MEKREGLTELRLFPTMEEEEEGHITIWKSNSMVSATVGRVMTSLLSARPKKLHDSISHLDSSPKPGPLGVSLENSLWILHKYVRDAAEKEESLDEVLVPMIEHSLKCKESRNKYQEMILLNWLFQDELLFQALARNFASIVLRKDDHHVGLGWCILARRLIEYETTMNQFPKSGVKERYNALLKMLCSCSTHLLAIVCNESTLQGGFELPTRLSVAAADCVVALSVVLTRKEMVSDISDNRTKSSKPYAQDLQGISVPTVGQKKVKPISLSTELPSNMEMRLLLWNLLDELIMLVQRLLSWSRKSRALHAKGLERVLKWLQGITKQYNSFKDQAGSQMVKTGVLLLSSCWKHYGILLHLEDHQISHHHKELLEQYLSGIEFYADNYTEEHNENKDSGVETINFFLNCLLLLLGRFTGKQFESAMTEYRLHISRVVTSQLCSADEDVIDGAVSVLKAIIFGTNHSVSGCSLTDSRQMNSELPLLLNLLDEQDGSARAVVTLIAEYCSISSDRYCLEEVLKRLATGNGIQRRNAVDVISKLIHLVLDSVDALSDSMWQDIANHLLDRLGDEEMVIRAHAANLIPIIDPSLVLPALVRLIYSSDGRLQSSASNTLIDILNHNKKSDVVCKLLDCLSSLNESLDLPEGAGNRREGLKLETDRVLKLIPEWSKSVKDWNLLVGPLIDKMFAEPSNATIVRFLSLISDHLAEAADIVFRSLLLHTESQKEIDEGFFNELGSGAYKEGDVKLQHSLFDRLCPLLIIRLLPLSVFNDLNSSLVYGDLLNQNNNRLYNISDSECIATLLLKRAFNKCEFEDVRKLAAELSGRMHPHVLLPALSSQLEYATNDRDVLKIKACLFSVCTSLVVRGRDSVSHPVMPKIREAIETVLLWPSMDGDEISKAQHGCIDCLAIMVCTELQDPEPFRDLTLVETTSRGKNRNAAASYAVHTYVTDQFMNDKNKLSSSKSDTHNRLSATHSLSFRLCMANVLISACQKISGSGRKPFAWKTLPRLIRSVSNMKESEIRAACIQVLFSIVYHLKSAVLPYTSDLLKVSVESLKGGSEKERMASAKLLASLMASEEAVVESISEGFLEARTLLSSISRTDSSSELRQLCTKLLVCMTSP